MGKLNVDGTEIQVLQISDVYFGNTDNSSIKIVLIPPNSGELELNREILELVRILRR